MKIGIIIDHSIPLNDDRFKILKQIGFDYGDYNNMDTNHYVHTCKSLAEVKEFALKEKALADEYGFRFNQTHGHWQHPFKDSTPKDLEVRFKIMKKSIYFASQLGCKYWIIHPIIPCGRHEKGKEQAKQTFEWNVEFMRKLAEYAAVHNIIVCLENMPFPEFSVATPQEILSIVKEVNHPNFGICFDTGHAAIFSKSNVGDDIRELGSYIKALHVHDNDGDRDAHWFPFKGIIDWKDLASALKEIDYDGVFSLEIGLDFDKDINEFTAQAKELYDRVISFLN